MSKITNLAKFANTLTTNANGELVTDPNVNGYDIVLVIGQSNTHYAIGYDAILDAPYDDIKQIAVNTASAYNNMIIPAVEPLLFPDIAGSVASPSYIGFGLTFAKNYIDNGNLKSGRKVCIVPAGWGGTGFGNNNRWNPGQDLYTSAVYYTNQVMTKASGSRLVAILWHQGENDSGQTQSWYSTRLDWMVQNLRNDILGDNFKVPFVCGGMVPYWVDTNAGAQPIEAALKDTPNRVAYSGFANPRIPTVIAYNPSDIIHYNAAGARELGLRYYTQWVVAKKNTLASASPKQPTNVVVKPGDGQVIISWTDPVPINPIITGYDIEYKQSSETTWLPLTSLSALAVPGYTKTGLTNNTSYDFRVYAINGSGRSEPSSSATAIPKVFATKTSDTNCLFWMDNETGTIADTAASKLGVSPAVSFTQRSGDLVTVENEPQRGLTSRWNSAQASGPYLQINKAIPPSYTKMGWVKFTSSATITNGYNNIISGESNTHAFGTGSTVYLNAGHAGGWYDLTGTTALSPGVWYHVAVAYDANTRQARLYVNGNLEMIAFFTKNLYVGSTTYIGAYTGSSNFHGWMDDMRIYNIALGGSEISEIAGFGTLPEIQSGANLIYRMDSTQGYFAHRWDGLCKNPFAVDPYNTSDGLYSILDRVHRYTNATTGKFRFRVNLPNFKWNVGPSSTEHGTTFEWEQTTNPFHAQRKLGGDIQIHNNSLGLVGLQTSDPTSAGWFGGLTPSKILNSSTQAGTITATTDSTTLTGTSTTFTSLTVGRWIWSSTGRLIGRIGTINNDTSITLADSAYFTATNETWYTTSVTGLINCSNGSTSVTGSGTNFTTVVTANSYLLTATGMLIGQVESVTNDTTIVLKQPAKFTSSSVGPWFVNSNPFAYYSMMDIDTSAVQNTTNWWLPIGLYQSTWGNPGAAGAGAGMPVFSSGTNTAQSGYTTNTANIIELYAIV